MNTKKAMMALALVAFLAQGAAAAIVAGIPYENEPLLYDVYNQIYGTSYTSNSDAAFLALQIDGFETWTLDPEVLSITFDALWRQSWLIQNVGYYTLDGSDNPDVLTQVIGPIDNSGPNSGQGLLTLPEVIVPTAGLTEIGFYDHATIPGQPLNPGFTWYSQPAQNDVNPFTVPNEVHVLLLTTNIADTYLLCFEDLPYTYLNADLVDIGDTDYQDILVQITMNRTIIPEPSSMALLGMGLAGLAVRRVRKLMA